MKNYDVLEIDNNEYKFFVISTSYETPLSYLTSINQELLPNYSCKVIFDFLLCSGNSSDRFYEAYFDGHEVKKSSFKNLKVEKKDDLRKISSAYLMEHKDYLNNSVLSSIQINMLSRGISI
ncbi:hypothetical protein GCM10008018_36930 [Paenibacillus marchantiophytorum]|uniref:Uncharacterized protein n=1 Tax=Paenibacillus marchantiophytorum TaxID=1619310 RepID=A0ABQ1EVG1_9BACL|nr:type II toxin-antitoxin system RnlB family antitoxin [Paenibacillus marchantiophytorum]GFZ87311.1 hypothetical protein GCM10008018_36930 [Paenibacillus marchantiophytorum]